MPLFPSDLFKELHGHFNTNQKGTNDNFVGEHVVPEENIGNYVTAPPLWNYLQVREIIIYLSKNLYEV